MPPMPQAPARLSQPVLTLAAAALAAAGLAAAAWSALASRRPDLAAPPPVLANDDGPRDEATVRARLAARFNVPPESLRLDGQPGRRARRATASANPAADAAPEPPPVFVAASAPEDHSAASSTLTGAVASGAVAIKGLSEAPTAAADAIARAAAQALLSPLISPAAAAEAWSALSPSSEGSDARAALAKALAAVFADAKIDPARARVTRFDPSAGPMSAARGPGSGERSRAVIAIPTPQAFPAVANMQDKPAVLVSLPVQLADGTGSSGTLALAVVLVFDAASKSWQPGMVQIQGENGPEVMNLAKLLRSARQAQAPAAANPTSAPTAAPRG